MTAAYPPVLPRWLKFLSIFAAFNLFFALSIIAVAHVSFGPMRPLDGFFIGAALALALLALVLFVVRYVWIVARRAMG